MLLLSCGTRLVAFAFLRHAILVDGAVRRPTQSLACLPKFGRRQFRWAMHFWKNGEEEMRILVTKL